MKNPTGSKTSSTRVLRGGAWNNVADFCRSAFRVRRDPGYRVFNLGFRLAMGGQEMKNPTDPRTGLRRVIRGGAWYNGADLCRSACCSGLVPGRRVYYLGFRLARSVQK